MPWARRTDSKPLTPQGSTLSNSASDLGFKGNYEDPYLVFLVCALIANKATNIKNAPVA